MYKSGQIMTKILLIDDSLTVRMELRSIFADDAFEITEASDGEQAIEAFKRDPNIDLIICDYNMPGMDGLSTLEEIYRISEEHNFSSIMLTTESSQVLKDKGRSIGVSGWLIKPFKKENLLKGVKTILSRKAA